MTEKLQIGVILAGCGHQDGSEIHEAVMTLLAIHKYGAAYQCYAPNINQHHVINHMTGGEMSEMRNVLFESARIARGMIKDLKEFDPEAMNAVIIPGGMGAAKNLSTFLLEGPGCKVHDDVAEVIRKMAAKNKPIGALCIAAACLPKLLDGVEVTLGRNERATKALENMGATPKAAVVCDLVVDNRYKVVTTPCYMLEADISQIAESADKLTKAVIDMI